MNPWHDVSAGKDAPEIINGIIENPKDTRTKYVLDKKTGLLNLESVIYSSMHYPANYGFIPKTYVEGDKAPLDILILASIPIVPMCIVRAKVIGAMCMKDGDNRDDKIIAVAADDISVSHINDVHEIPTHIQQDLKKFFECYAKLEEKKFIVDELQRKSVALGIVAKAIDEYRARFV